MKIKLAYKLFGALFLILIVVIGAVALSRHLFVQNFRNYIHNVQLERLQNLVPLLQAAYRNDDGWAGIKDDVEYWRQRLRHELDLPGSPPFADREVGPKTDRPRSMSYGVRYRFLLSDAQLHPIIGNPQPGDKLQLVAIQVDDQTVGWLGLTQTQSFRDGPRSVFIKQQYKVFYLLGGAVLIITVLIAALLTRHLLRPVKQLTEGARALAERDFSVRIENTSRDEFGLLAKQFNTMADILQTYERMRQQWLSDISHELRTPLAVLRGEIESLIDGIRQPNKQNLKSLHVETLHISKLVEDLHILSMVDSSDLKLNMQSVAPVDVLELSVEAFQMRLENRQIQLKLDYGIRRESRIHGDADRLGQVFSNILENARKYVRPPGALSVTAQAKDGFITFIFSDSGPGVPEESLPRLFDRLYRVDTSRGRQYGGSGLGLSICKHIVEHHSGSIWAENNTEGGLTIGIQLPLEEA